MVPSWLKVMVQFIKKNKIPHFWPLLRTGEHAFSQKIRLFHFLGNVTLTASKTKTKKIKIYIYDKNW